MSAKESQPGSGGGPQGKGPPRSSARESRDIIGLVKRAPSGALLVRDVPSVEEAPRRAQAPAQAPALRRAASLGKRRGSPSREPHR